MRPSICRQLPLTPLPIAHEHSRELIQISALLDAHPELESMVEAELLDPAVSRQIGRAGMSADQALRVLLVKQMNQFSYEELAFHLADSMTYAKAALQALNTAGMQSLPCAAKLAHYLPLAQRVIEQTRRRVIDGDKLCPAEKVLSIFEPDTDLIVSGRRDPTYGHKLCLTVGASSLVLDCVIEHGNPTDSTLAVKMIDRVTDIFGRPPKQAVFDGGFSSNDNLQTIKQRGVADVAFSKHLGIELSQMVRSCWLFKRLRRFRAGVEGCISLLKRCFGLARCTWRGGRERFAAYTWASILSANLLTLARHQLVT